MIWFAVVAAIVYYARKKVRRVCAPVCTCVCVQFDLLPRACLCLQAGEVKRETAIVTEDFKRFQRSYIVILLIVTAADWMQVRLSAGEQLTHTLRAPATTHSMPPFPPPHNFQGAYLYTLYSGYGFSAKSIGHLYMLGFASAALCSTFVGSLADKYGRKRLCQSYCVLYMCSCFTKRSSSFGMLAIGRILGGASASILVSSFESWMVHQHLFLSYPQKWMRDTFEMATSGTGIVAMCAGIVSTIVATQFGPVAPFDFAAVLVMFGLLLLTRAWPENYGDESISVAQTLENAYEAIKSDPVVIMLGISQSLFEAAMYVFVVMWTPALEDTSTTPVSHGWAFSTFMLCIVLGGTAYKQYLKYGGTVEKLGLFVYGVATLALLVPVLVEEHTIQMLSFCVFEVCVGVFWPTAGSLRSMYVPEDLRASVMATLRIPQNVIIVLVMTLVGRVPHRVVLFSSFLLAAGALAYQYYFIKLTVGDSDVIEELQVIVDENIIEGGADAKGNQGSTSKASTSGPAGDEKGALLSDNSGRVTDGEIGEGDRSPVTGTVASNGTAGSASTS